jgi:hypothetical protein
MDEFPSCIRDNQSIVFARFQADNDVYPILREDVT